MKTFATIAGTLGLVTQVAGATSLVPRCDLKGAVHDVTAEVASKSTNAARIKGRIAQLAVMTQACSDDSNHDGRVDVGEAADDIAAEAIRNAAAYRRDFRKRLAASVGWPVQSLTFKLAKRDLSGGSETNQASRHWAQQVGCADDDAGHIRGNALGGKGGKTSRNLFPQGRNVNRGAFAQYEGVVRSWVEQCHDGTSTLEVKVSFTFGDSVRPERPTYVHYTIRGGDPHDQCRQKTMSWSFANPRPSTCVE